MARTNRRDVLAKGEIQVVHCINRCVRRAYLCGRVCKWIGNSPKVAQKHYLQVLDEHFEKAVQNPVQQSSASLGNAPLSAPTPYANNPGKRWKSWFSGVKR